jgi:hypothetical protein
MGNEEKTKEFVGYGLPATGTIRWVGEYPKFVHFPLFPPFILDHFFVLL